MLAATEQDLLDVQARVQRPKKPLRGKDKIALAVGAVVNHYKMAKHFTVVIADNELTFERKLEQIEAEALLDGIYVLRTDLKLERSMPPRPSAPIKPGKRRARLSQLKTSIHNHAITPASWAEVRQQRPFAFELRCRRSCLPQGHLRRCP